MLTDPNIVNNIILAVIALANLFTAFLAFKNHDQIKDARNDIATIEKATNSMKDALVLATGKASRAEGLAEGLKQSTAREQSARLSDDPPLK